LDSKGRREQLNIFKINKEKYKFNKMSSKGIEPLTAINQFFYRESPLPIGSPALIKIKILIFFIFLILIFFIFLILFFFPPLLGLFRSKVGVMSPLLLCVAIPSPLLLI
jgi:hypothetical protein